MNENDKHSPSSSHSQHDHKEKLVLSYSTRNERTKRYVNNNKFSLTIQDMRINVKDIKILAILLVIAGWL